MINYNLHMARLEWLRGRVHCQAAYRAYKHSLETTVWVGKLLEKYHDIT